MGWTRWAMDSCMFPVSRGASSRLRRSSRPSCEAELTREQAANQADQNLGQQEARCDGGQEEGHVRSWRSHGLVNRVEHFPNGIANQIRRKPRQQKVRHQSQGADKLEAHQEWSRRSTVPEQE